MYDSFIKIGNLIVKKAESEENSLRKLGKNIFNA